MLSQDSDSFLDDGDDLAAAFLQEEAKAMSHTQKVEIVPAAKRSRQRSTSPVQDRPRDLDVKMEKATPKEVVKRTRAERSPSIELIEVRHKKVANIKVEPKSAIPIVVMEPEISWPPTKVPASDVIKQAHATHRKFIQQSTATSSAVPGPSLLSARNLDPAKSDKSIITLHPSLTDSSQATLKSKVEDFDEDMKPMVGKKKGVCKLKGKDAEEHVVFRDERGNLTERGKRALDKKILSTLGQEENAITNSDLYSRTTHIISSATGHQVTNGGAAKYSISSRDYNTSRNQKLRQQFTASPQTIGSGQADKESFVLQSKIFVGCTMWLNGYSGNKITDMELKKLIAIHGGMISMSEGSRITHVLVSERISGSKAEKFLRGATKAFTKNGKKKVVLVDWVLDSVREGKKLNEAAYHVIENESQPTIVSRFGFSSIVPSSTNVLPAKAHKHSKRKRASP